MAIFNATLAELAASRTVLFSRLVHFDFAEDDTFMWEGFGDLDLDGHIWKGDCGLGQISDIPVSLNDAAASVNFTLSGVDPKFAELAQQDDSVRGRDVTIFGQFFDEALAPIDDKFVLALLIMDTLSYSASGAAERSVSLTAETLWTGRNAASFTFFSDRDQQARFPGDRGLEFIAGLKNKKIRWPVY